VGAEEPESSASRDSSLERTSESYAVREVVVCPVTSSNVVISTVISSNLRMQFLPLEVPPMKNFQFVWPTNLIRSLHIPTCDSA